MKKIHKINLVALHPHVGTGENEKANNTELENNYIVLIQKDCSTTQEVKDIIVGTILGDGSIKLPKNKVNQTASMRFEQGSDHKSYLEFIHLKLLKYTDSTKLGERVQLDKRYNKENISYHFATRLSTFLYPFSGLFLKLDIVTGEYRKVVPSFSIFCILLTPRALAFWIGDDGQYNLKGGLTLCTDNFTHEEVLILKLTLETNFKFICTIHNKLKKGKVNEYYYRIYISSKSSEVLFNLVSEYMHPSMLYKINIPVPKVVGSLVSVLDTETNIAITYASVTKVAEALNCSTSSIKHYKKQEKDTGVKTLIKGKYLLTFTKNR